MSRSVIHTLAPARYGGLESVVSILAAGQARRGDDVCVVATFTSSPVEHPFWDYVRSSPGVRAIPLVGGGRQYLKERRLLRELIGDIRPEVLHTHGYRADVLMAPVARAEGVSTVTTVHGFTGNGLKNRTYEWLQRRAYRSFDAVVAVSEGLSRELERDGVPGAIIHAVQNAWAPTDEFLSRGEARAVLGLEQEGRVVGWVGRMSPEKAPDIALAAFEQLGRGDAGLCFVGDGRLRSDLQTSVERRGTQQRVHWAGVVPRAGRYLRAFDALVISSWTEGTPIVLLEAMAAGVPIVTTTVGGIPDVVSSSEAWLVEPGDVRRMSEALAAVLSNDEEGRRRTESARRRLAQEHSIEPWLSRYADIYESCR